MIFNNADLHFLRELRTARSEGDAGKLDRARQTRTEELDIISSVDVVLSYTEVEHSVIHAYTDGAAQVVKCPWVVKVPDSVPSREGRSGLSFLGSFRHHPNSEGISWFARTVMPRLAATGQPIDLTIYGSGMGDDIRALEGPNIRAHGFVECAEDAFDRHLIFVAPLLSGAGIKGKVLAALARGIPCIVSPIAAEGIGLRAGHDCLIVENPRDWVDAITLLQTDATLWQELSDRSRAYLASAFSFKKGRAQMRRAFEAADLFGSRP
ncbi:MAG: glycosyltransferase family 4 protein [Sulfitobacter sp.]|nr:glycosyltransferase family 4 protein [Sulfitobacter sp.]